MKGFIADIEDATDDNTDFRRVLYTGKHLQLVLMSLNPGEEIGEEVHATHDQFFRIEKGKGVVLIDGTVSKIKKDHAVIVPAGSRHNIIKAPAALHPLCAAPAPRWLCRLNTRARR